MNKYKTLAPVLRYLHFQRRMKQTAIARMFGIRQGTVSREISRRSL